MMKKIPSQSDFKRFYQECKQLWSGNSKVLLSIALFTLVVFLIVPIYPTTIEENFEIQVPKKDYLRTEHPKHKIQITRTCVSQNQQLPLEGFKGVSSIEVEEFDKYPNILRVIELNYSDYVIGIFGLEMCDCLKDDEVDFNRIKTCELRNSMLYGYFKNSSDTYFPFVMNPQFEILAPNKEFTFGFEAIQTKEGFKPGRNLVVDDQYRLIFEIKRPARKIHPWASMIVEVINKAKDPLTAIYDANKEKWVYS